ncbi:hypothetical protein F5B22DRAFT_641559 [Xylaria bambusicola]|uniref:uncharacterized protein n=1 Tax=Xylaria bambusicola TaxID=326684 RepID=UPI0020089C65|nr:uncharacterized protein F5B22DRAFT_641559 [Xylaria bambusicola]KAI0526413.1 hypothetical protein F5B22DRAFT_641559 [Xylaria bambusicola]
MAPADPPTTLPPLTRISSNREDETPAAQAFPPSSSWKSKFQKHVNSWLQPGSNEPHVEDAQSLTFSRCPSSATATTRSAHVFSEFRRRLNNTATSSSQSRPLQSESLGSLTSASIFSRKSYPSIFSNGTDATSISGTFATCGVTCSVDSPSVRLYKPLKTSLIIYVARDDIEIPLDVLEQWETTDLGRLRTDLSEVIMEIYRKGIDRESRRHRTSLGIPQGVHEYDVVLELRMSGRAPRDANQVAIRPSIWIICGSTWACKDIMTAMEHITWLTLPVEVHEGRVPIPSGAEGKVDVKKLDLANGCHLGNGVILYIHIEDSLADSTSCGLLCCATIKDGDNYLHRFSRIGGLVLATNTLKSSQYGVSTAHGMLDYPWWHRQLRKRDSLTTWDCQSAASTSDGVDDADRDINPHSPIFSDDNEPREGYRDPQLVPRWRNVTRHGFLSFMGTSVATEDQLPLHNDQASQTDHAMIDLGYPQDTSSSWDNKYRPRRTPSEGFIDVTTYTSNRDLTKGEVSILCQADSPVAGQLVPASICLAMGGRMFTLRKLRTPAPLARGVSGSWVTRGTDLCGMVIAVSNPEPYVYMTTAEDLMYNLEASSPSIETIEVFKSHSRKAMRDLDKAVMQMSSSQNEGGELMAPVASLRASTSEQRPVNSTRRSLSSRVRSLRGLVSDDLYRRNGLKLQRTRSLFSVLSNRFSSKVEEIIQPAHQVGTKSSVKHIPEAKKLNRDCHIINHHPVHAKIGYIRKSRSPLEPISEIVVLGNNMISDSEYVFMKSTARIPNTTFQHGDIRLIPPAALEPNLDVNLECDEYETALRRTAHDWLDGSYESQQEQQIDEIEELLDWWESFERSGLITKLPDEETPRPKSATSDDFPGISYSDTTSEGSISSCQIWAKQVDSAAYRCLLNRSYELKNAKRISTGALSEDNLNLGGLAGFIGTSEEACEVDCV